MEQDLTIKGRNEQTREAWNAYQYWTSDNDVDTFEAAYIGCYESRDAFGQDLLQRIGAEARLERLPDWLRGYLRFDGEAVLRDFEIAGHFWVWESPVGRRCYVFDAFEVPAKNRPAVPA